MGIEFNRTNDALPAARLGDIQFRLELLERFANRIADDIEELRAALRTLDIEALRRARDAWDGKG